MKNLLIDPYAAMNAEALTYDPDAMVREIDREDGLSGIYAALSGAPHDVTRVDCVRLENGDVIYVDDEGLFAPGRMVWALHVEGASKPLAGLPLAGRGLVVGTDSEGNDTPPKSTLAEILAMVAPYGVTGG